MFEKSYFAPGKLVIAGDYAVLDGAPAISMAINRGVRCTVTHGSGIVTPMGDNRFVKAALMGQESEKRFVFEAENPVKSIKEKPGFGGSAAACVTACLAVGRSPTDAISIHRQIQGSGSGIDVLTAIHGGCLTIHNGEISPVDIPTPVVIWSGNSAKTGPRVEQYLNYSNRRWFVDESKRLTEAFEEDPIHVVRQLYRLLNKMSQAAKVAYMTPALKEIVSLAEEWGGAAKPSGAGGGDCAIAFFKNQSDMTGFKAKLHATGYKTIPTTIGKGAHQIKGQE